MSLHVFFNPELVERLAVCGITARRRMPAPPTTTPAQGFVLEGRATGAQVPRTVTHRIGTHGSVTITEQRLLPAGRPEAANAEPSPQTALELVVECQRLRQDNLRLTDEVSQLRAEVDRLTARSGSAVARCTPEDDTAQRFALLELD